MAREEKREKWELSLFLRQIMKGKKKKKDKEMIMSEAEGKAAECEKPRVSFKKVVNLSKSCKYQGRLTDDFPMGSFHRVVR